MSPKDALSMIRKAAPAVATALGGPLAGTAAALVAGKLGVEPTPAAIATALQGDPTAAVKLAEIEAELSKAELLDVQDARRTFGAQWPILILTAALLGMFAAQAAILTLVEIPSPNRDVITLLAGQVAGFAAAAVGYWFGPAVAAIRK